MRIWLSNGRGDISQAHEFFSVIWRSLHQQCSAERLEHFVNLRTLAELPWLDQPRKLDSGLFALELYAAWDRLWKLELSQLVSPERHHKEFRRGSGPFTPFEHGTFGDHFAKHMHQLASFAASSSSQSAIRAATHRRLALGLTAISELRLIQGGQTRPKTLHS
jgi:hypothetical protein